MSTTIPQQFQQPLPISGPDLFIGDVVTPLSSSSSSSATGPSSLLFSSISSISSSLSPPSSSPTPGRMRTISPMTRDATAPHYQHPPPPTSLPMAAYAGTGTTTSTSTPASTSTSTIDNSFHPGPEIPQPQGPVFQGVDYYHHPHPSHHHHHPPGPPPPSSLVHPPPAPILLPSQHGILQARPSETLIGNVNNNTTNMNGGQFPGYYQHTPTTLPSIEPTDQPPGSQASRVPPPPPPQPKKRGRKPKNYSTALMTPPSSFASANTASSSSSSSATPGDSIGPPRRDSNDRGFDGLSTVDEGDPRRRRVLERNRLAATKCRVRKRDEASALAVKEQVMEDQHRALTLAHESLTAEVYHLKTQLLRHSDCECILIQKYIANEARRSVDGLTPISLSPAHSQHCPASSMAAHAAVPLAPIAPVAHVTPAAPGNVVGSIGGGSASPYPYGRLGSSTGSSADSVNLRGPEENHAVMSGQGPIIWTNPFLQNVATAPPTTSNPQLPPRSLPPPPLPPPPPPHPLPLHPSHPSHPSSSSSHTPHPHHPHHPSQNTLPPSSMVHVHGLPMTPVDAAGFGDGLTICTGPQSQPANAVGWDYQWEFQ